MDTLETFSEFWTRNYKPTWLWKCFVYGKMSLKPLIFYKYIWREKLFHLILRGLELHFFGSVHSKKVYSWVNTQIPTSTNLTAMHNDSHPKIFLCVSWDPRKRKRTTALFFTRKRMKQDGLVAVTRGESRKSHWKRNRSWSIKHPPSQVQNWTYGCKSRRFPSTSNQNSCRKVCDQCFYQTDCWIKFV